MYVLIEVRDGGPALPGMDPFTIVALDDAVEIREVGRGVTLRDVIVAAAVDAADPDDDDAGSDDDDSDTTDVYDGDAEPQHGFRLPR